MLSERGQDDKIRVNDKDEATMLVLMRLDRQHSYNSSDIH